MIKLVLWGVRQPGLTHRQFVYGNHVVHGDLVRNGPDSFREQISGYTQSYVTDAAYGSHTRPRIDSVSELWYASPATAHANFTHPYYRDVVFPDGANFADESIGIVYFAEEELLGAAAPLRGDGIKVCLFLAAPDGVAATDLSAVVDKHHAAAAQGLTGLLARTRNHTLATPAALNGTPPTLFDAYWLDGPDDLPAFDRYVSELFSAATEAGVLSAELSFHLVCSERRVVDVAGDH